MFVERAVELLQRAFKHCSLSLLRLDNHCVRGASILNCLMQHFQFFQILLSFSRCRCGLSCLCTPVLSDPFYFLDFSCLLIMMKLRKECAVSTLWHSSNVLAFLFTSYLPGRGELCLGTFGRFLNQFLFSVPESGPYFFVVGHFEIEFSKAALLSLLSLCFFTVKMEPISRSVSPSLSCNRLIFPSLPALSIFRESE